MVHELPEKFTFPLFRNLPRRLSETLLVGRCIALLTEDVIPVSKIRKHKHGLVMGDLTIVGFCDILVAPVSGYPDQSPDWSEHATAPDDRPT